MDYGQFLMACINEYILEKSLEIPLEDIHFDEKLDYLTDTHDELLDNIMCAFYIDHNTEKCPVWHD